MSTLKYAGAVAVISALLPVAALAATFPNIQFSNNQTTTDCTAGQSVNFTARVNVPAGEVVEKVQVDVISDGLAPALAQDVGGQLGLQEGQSDVNLVAPCPQNTGYYTIEVRGSGIFGGQRSNSITDGVVSVNTFGSALRVVASGSGSGPVIGGSWLDSLKADLMAYIKALFAEVKPTPPPPPPVDPVCAAYKAAKEGTMYGVNSQANVRFQGFLLSQGLTIPALEEGAAFGFWGPQTAAANTGFLATHPTCL